VLQHDIVWEDAAATRQRIEPRIAAEAAGGAELVVLPEMWATGFSANTSAIAEQSDGPTTTFMAESAAAHAVTIIGSVCQYLSGAELPSNVAVVAHPDGRVDTYAKRHLFSYAGEHKRISAGDDLLTVTVNDLRVSVFVCYDLRFADDFWGLAPTTDAYVVVANWPAERVNHWRALLLSRAIENQAWVVGANRVGSGGRLHYSGDSMVIDPLGRVVADGAGGEELSLTATLDASVVSQTRERYPFLDDR
jgi:predicted amidohydrolase